MTTAEKKILIIEDEPDISMVLQAYLKKAGFEVKAAQDGKQGLALFASWKPSLVLLDMMLPDMDGWAILRTIRDASACPVILLTALSDITHRLNGLNAGADDYICKPFVGEEVVARVLAVLRRPRQLSDGNISIFGSLRIDYDAREVTVQGRPITLNPRDLELLLFLSAHPNQTFSREQLIASVWGIDYEGSNRAVDLSINRIRQALAGWPKQQGEIVTLRRLGYKFRVQS